MISYHLLNVESQTYYENFLVKFVWDIAKKA